ncbi:xylulokinase [Salinarimonas rosea]|uniref:xylulokinase n=1 Tax=Salinarimonas rosea TaxID=552063 RepID=UPI0005BB035C|nr:FGGY family carbohydrate kinase [Salinarimonas rosea]
MPEVLLGIDAGTSAVKVCAFDRAGRMLDKAQRPVTLITVRPRWAELDLEAYWDSLADAIGEIVARLGSPVSLGLATTCPTTVLLDEDLRPVRCGITYLDNRAGGLVERFEQVFRGADAFFAKTGNRLSPSTASVLTVRWVMENEPEAWRRVCHVGFLNSFLAARLTGQVGVDWTQASYSGLFALHKPGRAWDPKLLNAFGIDGTRLPPILAPYERLGVVGAEASARTSVESGVPVAIGGADTATAAFALGINEARTAFESVGTSGVVSYCLDEPKFDPTFLNRCHVVPDRWLAHGAMSTAGGAFGWLKDKVWPEFNSLADLERVAAGSPPGANGVVFLPYLCGERSPIWDPAASGSWVGLRMDTSRADLVRAAFEGTAFGLRQIVSRAETSWNWRPKHMLCVGGGASSRFWVQIKADVLGIEFTCADLPDAAGFGAALLGGIAAGIWNGVDDPALPQVRAEGETVRPSDGADTDVYRRAAAIYDDLYPALAGQMARLAACFTVPG